jgi:hypothetical protein
MNMNILMFAITKINSALALLTLASILNFAIAATRDSEKKSLGQSGFLKEHFLEEISLIGGLRRRIILLLDEKGKYSPLTKNRFLLLTSKQKSAWAKFVKSKKEISENLFKSDDPEQIYNETIDYLPHNDYVSGYHIGQFDSTVEMFTELNNIHPSPNDCADSALPPLPRKDWSNQIEATGCWFLNSQELDELNKGFGAVNFLV